MHGSLFLKNSDSGEVKSFFNLLSTSLLVGTDGPAEFSARGLWARGEEGLSSSGTSLVTSTVSTGWICVSDGKNEKDTEGKKRKDLLGSRETAKH